MDALRVQMCCGHKAYVLCTQLHLYPMTSSSVHHFWCWLVSVSPFFLFSPPSLDHVAPCFGNKAITIVCQLLIFNRQASVLAAFSALSILSDEKNRNLQAGIEYAPNADLHARRTSGSPKNHYSNSTSWLADQKWSTAEAIDCMHNNGEALCRCVLYIQLGCGRKILLSLRRLNVEGDPR